MVDYVLTQQLHAYESQDRTANVAIVKAAMQCIDISVLLTINCHYPRQGPKHDDDY
jgi:hypothetical protein